MDYREQLRQMVNYVKEFSKASGEKINQDEMSRRMGFKNRTYLSQLLNGHEAVNEGHILKFKSAFREYLPKENDIQTVINRLDIIDSSIEVLMREFAKMKASLPDGRDPKAYLNELKQEIELVAIERHDS